MLIITKTNMNELVIRRFNENDLDKTYEMIQKALSISNINKIYEKKIISRWSNVYTKQYIIGTSHLRHFYVAEIDGNIVGTCTIHKDGDKGYISCVYTDPEVQGKGIAKTLLGTVLQDEVCNEVDSVILHAVLSAVTFYKRMGFHFLDEMPVIILDSGVEVVTMEKTLR